MVTLHGLLAEDIFKFGGERVKLNKNKQNTLLLAYLPVLNYQILFRSCNMRLYLGKIDMETTAIILKILLSCQEKERM